MRISELGQKTGLSNDTLRYYEKRGLIRSERLENGYRDYSEAMVFVLNYIQTAQKLGFTLAEISKEVPRLFTDGITPEAVQEAVRGKLKVVDEKIRELQHLREELDKLLKSPCPVLPAGSTIQS